MILIALTLIYFLSLVAVFIINESVNDWDYLPGYIIYVILAPVTLPITILTLVAYLTYNKYIKPRIIK